MPGIRVKDGESFESALRRFKKKCEKAGIMADLRRHQHFEKPSERRKRKMNAAMVGNLAIRLMHCRMTSFISVEFGFLSNRCMKCVELSSETSQTMFGRSCSLAARVGPAKAARPSRTISAMQRFRAFMVWWPRGFRLGLGLGLREAVYCNR